MENFHTFFASQSFYPLVLDKRQGNNTAYDRIAASVPSKLRGCAAAHKLQECRARENRRRARKFEIVMPIFFKIEL